MTGTRFQSPACRLACSRSIVKAHTSSVPRFVVGLAIALTVVAPRSLRAGEPGGECPAEFPVVMHPENLDCPYHGFIIRGAVEGGGAGFRVSSAGDLNSDGLDDVLISTGPTYPPCSWDDTGCQQGTGAGEAYVIFGDPNLSSEATFDLADLNGVNGFQFSGLPPNAWFGLVVASVGDINNDGVDDVAISNVEGLPQGPVYFGDTYVVFGDTQIGSEGVFDLAALDGTNGFIARGLMSGYSVAAAGDINADGIDDLLIGAPTITPPDLDVDHLGRAYLIFGGAGDWPAVVELDDLAGNTGVNGTSGLAIEARPDAYYLNLGPRAAITVAGLGDVNVDGVDDLIVGVKGGNSGTGEVYVIFGGMGDWPAVVEAAALAGNTGQNGSSGFIAVGIFFESVGWAVSSAGDLNDDGINDLLVGAPAWTSGGFVGRGYVVFGSADLGSDGEFDLQGLDGDNGFIIEGDGYGDEQHMGLGSSLSVARDLNGDGVDDVVLGTAEMVVINIGSGELFVRDEAFVVFGGADVGASGLIVITGLDGSNGFKFEGSEELFDRSETSRSVASAGDLNGDGFDDIVIGAPGAGQAGEAYVLWGCPQLGDFDCDENHITDACETDCNDNGILDECDIEDGTSEDCNNNSVPDDCDMADGDSDDCNGNFIPDECDVADGTSEDCNNNTIPDECDADCNENGLADECDIANGTSADCNSNNIPDECDIAAEDCNNSGLPDECDIDQGASEDCNGNLVPDECDLDDGGTGDCNANDIPDECESGGPSFSWPRPLNSYAAEDQNFDWLPHLATDGAGTWVAAWTTDHNLHDSIGFDFDILYSRSTDYGAQWSAPAALNSHAEGDSGPDLAAQVASAGAGQWLAVWESGADITGDIGFDFDILFSRSTDNGATWSEAVPLNTNADSDARADYSPRIASDGLGTWIATWISEDSLGGTIGIDPDILYARSTDNGVTWSHPAPLNTNAGSDAGVDRWVHLATDGAGAWIALWSSTDELDIELGEDFDVLQTHSTDNGVTWSDPSPLNTNAASDLGDDFFAAIATNKAGLWIAVWTSNDDLSGTIGTDYDILYSRSMDAGLGWSAPKPLNDNANIDSGDDNHPRIAATTSGTWLAVWDSPDDLEGPIGTDWDIVYARSTIDVPNWSHPEPLNANAAVDVGGDHEPQIATDGAGRWMAIWQSSDPLDGTIGFDEDILFTRFELGLIDCNDNNILDSCDVTDGTSTDANGNGIPDECECLADLDGDGGVGPFDLALLLGSWGPCVDPEDCQADLDGDGAVGPFDLALLLGDWGLCS